MRKEVEKFINYLKITNKNVEEKILKLSLGSNIANVKEQVRNLSIANVRLTNYIRMLSAEEKNWKSLTEVFGDFDIISEYLVSSTLTTKEQMNIIMYFFEKNIAAGILASESMKFDFNKIKKHKFKYISKQEMVDLVQGMNFREFLNTDDEKLSEKDRKIKEEIMNFMDHNQIDISDVIKQNRIINDCYLTKKDKYTKEDIEKVMTVLISLDINNELCNGIRYLLEKNLEKRNNRKQTITLKKEEPKIKRLTSKEYNVVYKEVRQYFDIVRMLPVRPLSLDESIYLTHLLVKMNVEKNQIDLILNMVEMENKRNSQNPLAIYSEIYDKLKYYEEEIGSEELNVLNDYMNELFICNNSDYLFWKGNFKNDLDNLIKQLPKEHRFEFEQAKKVKTK